MPQSSADLFAPAAAAAPQSRQPSAHGSRPRTQDGSTPLSHAATKGSSSGAAYRDPASSIAAGAAALVHKPHRPRPRPRQLSQRQVTVPLLLQLGLIPEHATVKCVQRGSAAAGMLQASGAVHSVNAGAFDSVADFATAVKRRAQPGCRPDDGWRSCSVNGKALHDIRAEACET